MHLQICEKQLLALTRLPVCLSVHTERLGSHWMGFPEILYLSFFQKSLKKIQVLLKSDKNNRYFTRRPIYIFDHILS